MVHYRGHGLTLLNVVRKRNPNWRPAQSLLDPTSEWPIIKNGTIDVERKFDRWKPPKSQSPRFYRELATRRWEPPKHVNFSMIDNTNCHELDGTIRFHIQGEFKDKGNRLSFAIKNVAKDLHLVGWCRIRHRSGEGVLQGDVFGLNDAKNWLKSRVAEDHKTTINRVSFSEETAGLDRLKYPDFLIFFDNQRKDRAEQIQRKVAEKRGAQQYLEKCFRHAQQKQHYYDEHFYSRT